MSEVTENWEESVGWVLLTVFFTWLFFGVFSYLGFAATVLLFNPVFIVLLALVGIIQFGLDVLDQKREVSMIALWAIFVTVALTLALLNALTFTVAGIGWAFYLLALIFANELMKYLKD